MLIAGVLALGGLTMSASAAFGGLSGVGSTVRDYIYCPVSHVCVDGDWGHGDWGQAGGHGPGNSPNHGGHHGHGHNGNHGHKGHHGNGHKGHHGGKGHGHKGHHGHNGHKGHHGNKHH